MYRVAHALLENGTAKMICSDAHGTRHMDSLNAIAKSPVVHRGLRRATCAAAS